MEEGLEEGLDSREGEKVRRKGNNVSIFMKSWKRGITKGTKLTTTIVILTPGTTMTWHMAVLLW